MELKPRLEKTIFYYTAGNGHRYQYPIEEWKEVGLGVVSFTVNNTVEWRVTHVDSGMFVLARIKTRDEAIQYMMDLRTILRDWKISVDAIKRIAALPVKIIQERIDKGEVSV